MIVDDGDPPEDIDDEDPLKKDPPMFRDHARGLRGVMISLPFGVIVWVVIVVALYLTWKVLFS